MKKMIAFLLALMLPVCAGAETLAQQIGVPSNISETWTSNSGKLTIVLDADVVIPEVENMFCIDTTVHVFTPEEIQTMASLLMPVAPQTPAYELKYSGRYDSWRYNWASDGHAVGAGYSVVRNQITDVYLSVYHQEKSEQGLILDNYLPFTQHAAQEHPMSPEEAQTLADAAAQAVAPGFEMTGWGVEESVPVSAASQGRTETQTEFPDYPEYYIFCYTPVIDGIPQLATFTDCANDDSMMFPFRCNRFYIAVDADGIAAAYWQAPEEYGERRACTLLSFGQVMNIAESLLPLTQADVERRYGDRQAQVQIRRITLSYCRVQKRDEPGRYELAPVWDFFGQYGYMDNSEFHAITMEDEGPYNTLLTINAMDGMVIDRGYGY